MSQFLHALQVRIGARVLYRDKARHQSGNFDPESAALDALLESARVHNFTHEGLEGSFDRHKRFGVSYLNTGDSTIPTVFCRVRADGGVFFKACAPMDLPHGWRPDVTQ